MFESLLVESLLTGVLILLTILYVTDLASGFYSQYSIKTIDKFIKFKEVKEFLKYKNLYDVKVSHNSFKISGTRYKMELGQYLLFYHWYTFIYHKDDSTKNNNTTKEKKKLKAKASLIKNHFHKNLIEFNPAIYRKETKEVNIFK